MRTTNFDALFASVPNNRTAAVVVSVGEYDEPSVQTGRVRSDNPLPIIRTPSSIGHAHNLFQCQIGRLLVVGYAAGQSDKIAPHNARWVVRCACGAFEHRIAKTLLALGYADRAMCQSCDAWTAIKAGTPRIDYSVVNSPLATTPNPTRGQA